MEKHLIKIIVTGFELVGLNAILVEFQEGFDSYN